MDSDTETIVCPFNMDNNNNANNNKQNNNEDNNKNTNNNNSNNNNANNNHNRPALLRIERTKNTVMSVGLPSLVQGPRPTMTYFAIYQPQPEEPEVNLEPTNGASLKEKDRAIFSNICLLFGILLTM